MSQDSKSMSHEFLPTSFDPVLHFFSLVPHVTNINRAIFEVSSFPRSRVVYMHAKFQVFSFTRSRDMEKVTLRRSGEFSKYQSTSREPISTFFDLFFSFFCVFE